MIFGTHNSATGGQLLWWLRPLAWIINPTSKCQDRSIVDQLADGVKVFNLQVTCINNTWRFTHGLAIYKENIFETLAVMKACATKESPIYFLLYLDKCFWGKQNIDDFIKLIAFINLEYLEDNVFMMFNPWIESTQNYLKFGNANKIDLTEHYWTLRWAENNAESWIDKLPLPKYHAKKYNKKYIDECKKQYLMLDFYEYKNEFINIKKS